MKNKGPLNYNPPLRGEALEHLNKKGRVSIFGNKQSQKWEIVKDEGL